MSKKNEPVTAPPSSEPTEMVDSKGQIVTADRKTVAVPTQQTPLSECPTSLDIRTKRGKALLIAAGNPGSFEMSGNGVVKIRATDWLLMPDFGTDPETGEYKEYVRLVLFDKSGNTYRTTSAHGPKRLAAMLQLYSRDEWDMGIDITITERRSRKTSRTYHDIRVDWDVQE